VFFIFQLSHGESQIFPSGSRVCFVGNSITNNGEFHHNILLFHLTRYPKENVSFFNCGISGDVTAGILNRMEDDILIHQPTHIVLMIGMNDVRRSLYSENISTNSDTLEQREKAILN
jgi:endoglucanase